MKENKKGMNVNDEGVTITGEDFLERIKRKMKTERFKMSSELIGLKLKGLEGAEKSNWSFGEMANMAGMTRKEYLGYEYGDEDIPIESFKQVIKKVKQKMREYEGEI